MHSWVYRKRVIRQTQPRMIQEGHPTQSACLEGEVREGLLEKAGKFNDMGRKESDRTERLN